MVNLDLLSKNAAALLPVSGVVDTVVVRLGRLMAQKLLESGYTTAAHLLSLEHTETASHDEADQYLTHFDCPLMFELRTATALGALQTRYATSENRILELLALRARRELNLICEEPPLATRLAHELESLLAASPLRGAQADKLSTLQNQRLQTLTSRCTELLTQGPLLWGDLVLSRVPFSMPDTLLWAHRMMQATAHLTGVVHRLDSQFGKDPVEDSDHKHPHNYRQILKHRQKKLREQRVAQTAPARPQSRRWEDDAAQLIAERNFHAFAICVDTVIEQLNLKLDLWTKNELARSSRQKNRLLDGENFHYADGIRRCLHQLGESLEDALVCAEKILHYCQENQVPASEIMDDEIWGLFPRINRENLKQARLKVRHSDIHYPLSVAHREWITQITDSALAHQS